MRTRSKYLKFSVNNEGKILIQHDFYKYFDDKHDCEYKVFIIYGNKIFPELDYEECTNKKTGITNIKFHRILYVTEIYIRSMNGPESRDTNVYSSRRFQNHPINKRLKTYVEQRILSSIFKDAN